MDRSPGTRHWPTRPSIVAATDLPVSADLEDCFAAAPAGVADTVALAVDTGLAGCSIEDFTRDREDPIYELALAAERVAAAAEAAHAGPVHLVLTARAENYLYGRQDLADTIARLQAFQEAGADVLYAPGLVELDDIRAVVAAVERPVNVLARPGGPPVPELAAAGVARVSIGGAFAFAALGRGGRGGRRTARTGDLRVLGAGPHRRRRRPGRRSPANGDPLRFTSRDAGAASAPRPAARRRSGGHSTEGLLEQDEREQDSREHRHEPHDQCGAATKSRRR